LNIPTKPIPTAENEILYDNLREQILIMLNLKKYLNKKTIVTIFENLSKSTRSFQICPKAKMKKKQKIKGFPIEFQKIFLLALHLQFQTKLD